MIVFNITFFLILEVENVRKVVFFSVFIANFAGLLR